MTVLRFMAEHHVVRASQVRQLLGVSHDAAQRRLRRLRTDHFVVADKLWADQPMHYSISLRGLGAVGSHLPEPQVRTHEFRHDIGLAWTWLSAHDGAFGALRAVHAERQMRSADARAGDGEERYGLSMPGRGPAGGRLTHYPDLLLETADGHRVAVELELTGKSAGRLDKIMGRYVADRRIDAVVYLVEDPRVARLVREAAARQGASELVRVRAVTFAEPTGPSRDRGGLDRGRPRSRSWTDGPRAGARTPGSSRATTIARTTARSRTQGEPEAGR